MRGEGRCWEPVVLQMMLDYNSIIPWPLAMVTRADESWEDGIWRILGYLSWGNCQGVVRTPSTTDEPRLAWCIASCTALLRSSSPNRTDFCWPLFIFYGKHSFFEGSDCCALHQCIDVAQNILSWSKECSWLCLVFLSACCSSDSFHLLTIKAGKVCYCQQHSPQINLSTPLAILHLLDFRSNIWWDKIFWVAIQTFNTIDCQTVDQGRLKVSQGPESS